MCLMVKRRTNDWIISTMTVLSCAPLEGKPFGVRSLCGRRMTRVYFTGTASTTIRQWSRHNINIMSELEQRRLLACPKEKDPLTGIIFLVSCRPNFTFWLKENIEKKIQIINPAAELDQHCNILRTSYYFLTRAPPTSIDTHLAFKRQKQYNN